MPAGHFLHTRRQLLVKQQQLVLFCTVCTLLSLVATSFFFYFFFVFTKPVSGWRYISPFCVICYFVLVMIFVFPPVFITLEFYQFDGNRPGPAYRLAPVRLCREYGFAPLKSSRGTEVYTIQFNFSFVDTMATI